VAADEVEFAYALARMAKALAHPTRVEIVRFLLEQRGVGLKAK
jgi:DNA-binding transcriptional ArsR family regulator